MTRCPFCDFEAATTEEEIKHITSAHQDVIQDRLVEIATFAEAALVRPWDKLGGLLETECEVLARHSRGEAEIFERMAEVGADRTALEGFARWMRERAGYFKEWAALEALRQEEFGSGQRMGPR